MSRSPRRQTEEEQQRANFLAFNWGNLWRVRTKQAKLWRQKKSADGKVVHGQGESEIQKEVKRIHHLILKISNMPEEDLAKKDAGEWDSINQELMDARLSCWKIIDSLRGGRLKNEEGHTTQAYQMVHTPGVERRNSDSILITNEEADSLEIEAKIVEIETLLAELDERRERGPQEEDPDAGEMDPDEEDNMRGRSRGSIGFTDAEKENIRSSLGLAQAKLAIQTIEDGKGDLVIAKPEAEDGTKMEGAEVEEALKTVAAPA